MLSSPADLLWAGGYRSYVDVMIRVNFMSPIDTQPIGEIRKLKQGRLKNISIYGLESNAHHLSAV
ncbi:hypothetical protein [Ancylothrix sp. D3o]|uniref:hypothetical protein n=1 Tax=Ancylothrix sp. D3o TaxID=2953691 RepID=UPI0021BAA9B6|nr:hypothetical protein [Ancylothrix sp. D3o]